MFKALGKKLKAAPDYRAYIAGGSNDSRDYTRWTAKPKTDSTRSAAARLRHEGFLPVMKPDFRIRRDDRLFAMGSCFARGIELVLKARGFHVESAASDFDNFEIIDNRKVTPLGFTNKYTTFSMLNELSWALDPDAAFPESSLVDLDAGTCIDPHINPTLKPVNRTGTIERRRIMTDVVRRIAGCRIVFLTLGLVEAWYDKQANVWLNSTPTPAMTALHPGRYEFAVTDYAANLANLEGLYKLLMQCGHPDLHIVVTVSPVPLNATFTGEDIVLANTYSKSTLRAIAGDWSRSHPNIQYFPSYEMVLNSDPALAWEDDLRHVRGAMTRHVMDYFVQAFAE